MACGLGVRYEFLKGQRSGRASMSGSELLRGAKTRSRRGLHTVLRAPLIRSANMSLRTRSTEPLTAARNGQPSAIRNFQPLFKPVEPVFSSEITSPNPLEQMELPRFDGRVGA